MPLANDHGLARDTGSHLIGTEWRYPLGLTLWRVVQAMYGVLRLQDVRGVVTYHTEDELRREMREVPS